MLYSTGAYLAKVLFCRFAWDDILEGNDMSGTSAIDIRRARNAVVAAFLGWTLDAFDFFILILTLDNVLSLIHI